MIWSTLGSVALGSSQGKRPLSGALLYLRKRRTEPSLIDLCDHLHLCLLETPTGPTVHPSGKYQSPRTERGAAQQSTRSVRHTSALGLLFDGLSGHHLHAMFKVSSKLQLLL